ncbi:SMC5-SMC6 complex localization factor protein 1 [Ambystoma mexicanum]|uniref:SMC5-SMC6 complex localization factor protein 1 n=1 Tax=Ambystoma mexicanum TaxID=8296 RepID=UPI0037E83D07
MPLEMEEHVRKPTIQLTGFKNKEKDALVRLLFKLDCIFIDSEKYADCTHLIAKNVCKSEKWLAACASGKWVLTKEYVIDSAKSGRWLSEATYEWGNKLEKYPNFTSMMNTAPKRWREELTFTGSPGAFFRWKVILLMKESDKRKDAFERVLLAGKATVCNPQNAEEGITHVFTNNSIYMEEKEKHVFGAPCYPVQYLGDFLLESTLESGLKAVQSSPSVFGNHQQEKNEDMLAIPFDDMKNVLWKRLCLAQAIHHKHVGLYIMHEEIFPEVKHIETLRVSLNRIEGLMDGCFFIEAIEELNFLLPYCAPPVYLLQTLLEHMLQGNINLSFSCRFFDIFYSLLHLHPPWKSPSMQTYFLDVLQCPVCKKGTWSFLEMLVRSCLDHDDFCHPMSQQEMDFTERRGVHGALLKYIADVLKAETQALSRRLCDRTKLGHLEVMPRSVIIRIFWPETKSSIFLTKSVNILVDWIIHSHREKYQADAALKHQATFLLHGILGSLVEYWILLGLYLDKYMMHHISVDLANYISILCDDFSSEEIEGLICSIPSPWLQMFVSDAVFRTLCLKNNLSLSSEPLSLRKLLCSYLPALSQLDTREVRRVQKMKGKKVAQRHGLETQGALPLLNDDKQSKAEVLPGLPALRLHAPPPKIQRRKLENVFISKENGRNVAQLMSSWKPNTRGETGLHTACKHNKVEKLTLLLSWPGVDINVKDYAGWTPLHEACNHGSAECVQEILQRCPEADLLSQVDGVTPLHDALSNGHIEIGKLLLQYGGPVLLQQRDFEGKLPLDYITSPRLKEDIFSILQLPETIEEFSMRMEKAFSVRQKEFGSFLLCRILLNFCSVYDLSSNIASLNAHYAMTIKSVTLDPSTKKVTPFTDWLVQQYAQDLDTLNNLPELLTRVPESLQQCDGFHTRTLLAVLKTMINHSAAATEP